MAPDNTAEDEYWYKGSVVVVLTWFKMSGALVLSVPNGQIRALPKGFSYYTARRDTFKWLKLQGFDPAWLSIISTTH